MIIESGQTIKYDWLMIHDFKVKQCCEWELLTDSLHQIATRWSLRTCQVQKFCVDHFLSFFFSFLVWTLVMSGFYKSILSDLAQRKEMFSQVYTNVFSSFWEYLYPGPLGTIIECPSTLLGLILWTKLYSGEDIYRDSQKNYTHVLFCLKHRCFFL